MISNIPYEIEEEKVDNDEEVVEQREKRKFLEDCE